MDIKTEDETPQMHFLTYICEHLLPQMEGQLQSNNTDGPTAQEKAREYPGTGPCLLKKSL